MCHTFGTSPFSCVFLLKKRPPTQYHPIHRCSPLCLPIDIRHKIKNSKGIIILDNTFLAFPLQEMCFFINFAESTKQKSHDMDESGEVQLSAAIKKFLIPSDNCNEQGVLMYNLDAIIAVGLKRRSIHRFFKKVMFIRP